MPRHSSDQLTTFSMLRHFGARKRFCRLGVSCFVRPGRHDLRRMNRRTFLHASSTLAAASVLPTIHGADDICQTLAGRARKFTLALTPGSLGATVKSQKEPTQ